MNSKQRLKLFRKDLKRLVAGDTMVGYRCSGKPLSSCFWQKLYQFPEPRKLQLVHELITLGSKRSKGGDLPMCIGYLSTVELAALKVCVGGVPEGLVDPQGHLPVAGLVGAVTATIIGAPLDPNLGPITSMRQPTS